MRSATPMNWRARQAPLYIQCCPPTRSVCCPQSRRPPPPMSQPLPSPVPATVRTALLACTWAPHMPLRGKSARGAHRGPTFASAAVVRIRGLWSGICDSDSAHQWRRHRVIVSVARTCCTRGPNAHADPFIRSPSLVPCARRR